MIVVSLVIVIVSSPSQAHVTPVMVELARAFLGQRLGELDLAVT